MIVPGSEEIKGLLGSRGIALFFFGSEGRFGVFSPSAGHWPSLSVRADTFSNSQNSLFPRRVRKYCYVRPIGSLHFLDREESKSMNQTLDRNVDRIVNQSFGS